MSSVTFATQTAVMQTGLLDADASSEDQPQTFDYNFAVKDLEGNKIPFEQFKGKVVFLNLWATWCGPCRAEMPTIQKLFDGISKDQIAFVILSLDKDQDKAKIVKYIKDKSFTFPVYQPSGYLSDQLQVPTIPTTLIISKDGKIVGTEVGTTNFNTTKFKKFITDLSAQ
jgi:thiol-disulfide isomerase/thioredoxin